MKDYIVLDNFQYKTVFGNWKPLINKPSRVKYLWNGETDVTYGPGLPYEWSGLVRAPVTATGAFGDIDDLRETIIKKEEVDFEDHYEDKYTVHVIGEITEDSFTPGWDSATNVFHVPVRIVRVSEETSP
jgi:hypothetical protein